MITLLILLLSAPGIWVIVRQKRRRKKDLYAPAHYLKQLQKSPEPYEKTRSIS